MLEPSGFRWLDIDVPGGIYLCVHFRFRADKPTNNFHSDLFLNPFRPFLSYNICMHAALSIDTCVERCAFSSDDHFNNQGTCVFIASEALLFYPSEKKANSFLAAPKNSFVPLSCLK